MNAQPPARREHLTTFYILTIIGGIGLFFLIRWLGEGIENSAITSTDVVAVQTKSTAHPIHPLPHILATLAVVILLGNILGRLCKYIGQPPVIGEIIAGLLLGPSLLGYLSPVAMNWLIPDATLDPNRSVRGSLQMISQLGIILYMFLVGMELNLGTLHREAKAAVAISHAGIVFPFVLGTGLALVLYPQFARVGVSFTNFSLFIGIAMSITAFPVLARILADRGMTHSKLGVIALGCAATDDVTAWCLLAFVIGIAQAQVTGAMVITILAAVYVVVMFQFVRPLIERWAKTLEYGTFPKYVFPSVLISVFASALITELIGIHAIFGAFVIGAMIPTESRLAHECKRMLQDVVSVVLLPAFFAITGMNTQIGLISSWHQWAYCGLIIAVATLGKFGGTVFAARFAGQDWRTSAALGALMNTRGLMGLIVLNVGLEMQIITPEFYAMMVVMAIATTMFTAPMLWWLYHRKPDAPETATITPEYAHSTAS